MQIYKHTYEEYTNTTKKTPITPYTKISGNPKEPNFGSLGLPKGEDVTLVRICTKPLHGCVNARVSR